MSVLTFCFLFAFPFLWIFSFSKTTATFELLEAFGVGGTGLWGDPALGGLHGTQSAAWLSRWEGNGKGVSYFGGWKGKVKLMLFLKIL